MIQLQNAQLVPARPSSPQLATNHSGTSVKKVLKKKKTTVSTLKAVDYSSTCISKCVARHSWTIYSSDRPMATLHQTQIQA